MSTIHAIDTHAHIFLRSLPLAAQRRHAPEHDATLAGYLAQLDANGISHGVLVQPSFLGTDNSFLLEALRLQPERLRGVAVVDPACSAEALQALVAQGIAGLRLNLVGLPLPDLRAGPWPAWLAAASQLGLHVELHRAAVDLPALLPPLLDAGCKVVVDHFGRPATGQGCCDPGFAALLRFAASGQVWVKLSAAYRSWEGPDACEAGAPEAQALLQAFGPERLLWGSDWPHTQHTHLVTFARARRALDRWVPDAAQRQTILAATPAALFNWGQIPIKSTESFGGK